MWTFLLLISTALCIEYGLGTLLKGIMRGKVSFSSNGCYVKVVKSNVLFWNTLSGMIMD